MKRRFAIAAVLLLALSLASADASAAKTKITLAQGSKSIAYLPFFIAQAKGYFDQEGIDLNTVYMQGGNPTVAAVMSGDAQFGAASYPVIVPAVQKGSPLMAFAVLQTADTVIVTISKAVEAKHPFTSKTKLDDRLRILKGLKIGITSPGSGADLTARLLLKRAGLNPDTDAQLVPLQATPAAMVAALKAGLVDAVMFDSITAAEAEHEGIGDVLVNVNAGEVPEERDFLYMLLFGKKDYLGTNRADVVAMDRALYRALKFIHEHPGDIAATVAPVYDTISPDVLKRAIELVLAGFPSTPVITPAMQRVANNYFKLARGDIVDIPFDQVIDTSAARQAVNEVDHPAKGHAP